LHGTVCDHRSPTSINVHKASEQSLPCHLHRHHCCRHQSWPQHGCQISALKARPKPWWGRPHCEWHSARQSKHLCPGSAHAPCSCCMHAASPCTAPTTPYLPAAAPWRRKRWGCTPSWRWPCGPACWTSGQPESSPPAAFTMQTYIHSGSEKCMQTAGHRRTIEHLYIHPPTHAEAAPVSLPGTKWFWPLAPGQQRQPSASRDKPNAKAWVKGRGLSIRQKRLFWGAMRP